MCCVFKNIILILFTLIPLILAIAYLTLSERKIMAFIQRRKGPNLVGFIGLLQPLVDGLKLLCKNIIFPIRVNFFLLILSPLITFILSLWNWAIFPFEFDSFFLDLNYSLLYFFVISSLGAYGVIFAGFSSNSKYALFGTVRTITQIISYEISFGLILIPLILCSGSLNFTTIIFFQKDIWNLFLFWPLFICFFISSLAETNRSPYLRRTNSKVVFIFD